MSKDPSSFSKIKLIGTLTSLLSGILGWLSYDAKDDFI